MEGQPFLAINGIQTLSHGYLDLMADMADMAALGVTHFRVMPHACDMVAVTRLYDSVLRGGMGAEEGGTKLRSLGIEAPFVNGFYRGRAGADWVPKQRAPA
jgi:collagenase-like PrtC family protease